MITFTRIFSSTALIRGAFSWLLLTLLGSLSYGQMTINGAGATFPYPIYSKWFEAYTKVDPSVRFNYQSIGSGGGQKLIMEQTVDFAGTDSPMTEETMAKAPTKLLHIPTVAGAVVVTYNMPSVTGLKLDGETLVNIFLGKIKKWNDPAIVRLNPAVKLSNEDVVVVHRSDGSGTSFIWTDYLSSVSPEWQTAVGKGTAVQWPAGIGAKGNEGVAGQVKQLPGAIGYVELIYALQNRMAMVDVQNKAGAFVSPSTDSVSAALASAQIPEDFRFSIVNSAGPAAYPISGATWILAYEQQKDHEKGKKLVEFLKWMVNEGEEMARELHYAPLTDDLRKRVAARIAQIKF